MLKKALALFSPSKPQRIARVRIASSLAAASLDDPFEHPDLFCCLGRHENTEKHRDKGNMSIVYGGKEAERSVDLVPDVLL